MRTYVTGANGFIGSHLLPKLKGEVIAIPHDQIDTFELDHFDYFYFLSTYGNLHHQEHNDEQIFKANFLDVLTVIQQIKHFKFKSFVYISSSSVKLRTQTMYSRSKRIAEEILLAMMEKYDIPVLIIRPFSVTGIGEQEEHLIPTLIESCLLNERMNFVPDATHDFINVEDVVDGIQSLAAHGARGIFELGTGVKTTNQQVLQIVERATGRPALVNKVDSLRPYDNTDWVSNNFKARGFGWLPKTGLEQTIKDMVTDQLNGGV